MVDHHCGDIILYFINGKHNQDSSVLWTVPQVIRGGQSSVEARARLFHLCCTIDPALKENGSLGVCFPSQVLRISVNSSASCWLA